MTVCFLAEQVNHLILVEPPSTDKGWPPALREYVHHKVASNASAEIVDRLKTMSDEELWAVDWSCEPAIGEQCYLLSSVLVPPPLSSSPAPTYLLCLSLRPATTLLCCLLQHTHSTHRGRTPSSLNTQLSLTVATSRQHARWQLPAAAPKFEISGFPIRHGVLNGVYHEDPTHPAANGSPHYVNKDDCHLYFSVRCRNHPFDIHVIEESSVASSLVSFLVLPSIASHSTKHMSCQNRRFVPAPAPTKEMAFM